MILIFASLWIRAPLISVVSIVAVVFGLGDTVAHGTRVSIGVAAAEAVAEAILRAVKLAPSLGGLPGLH